MLKVGEKIRCIDNTGSEFITNGKVYRVEEIVSSDKVKILADDGMYFTTTVKRFEKYNSTAKKNFREVIAGIKLKQKWTDGALIVEMKEEGKIELTSGNLSVAYGENYKEFKLVREQYSLVEALEAVKKGYEIESVTTEYKFKKEDGKIKVYDDVDLALREFDEESFSYEELLGKWYINK